MSRLTYGLFALAVVATTGALAHTGLAGDSGAGSPGTQTVPVPVPEPEPQSPESFDPAVLADRPFVLRVRKAARRLEVVSPPGEQGKVLASWPMGLGFAPVGDKKVEGDGRTPEGGFRVVHKNAQSRFYKAFLLSYPEVDDAEQGLEDGRIDETVAREIQRAHRSGRAPPQDTALGGWIEIHGRGGGDDWTLGCVAVDDEVIDLLWPYVREGTRVIVQP